MDKIKAGIIGLGRFARYHLECLSQMRDVQLVAVADSQRERMEQVAQDWGCSGYTSGEEMVAAHKLDAVLVLTPEARHVAPVLAAIENGNHVFVEKPLTLDSASAQQLIDRAIKSNRLLMVGHVTRFEPRFIKLRKAIREGKLGALRSMYCRRNNPKKYFPIYKRSHPAFILGIHDIDLMLWLSGSRVTEVFAKCTTTGGAPDLVWSMLTFDNGSIGVIENQWLMPDHTPSDQDICMELVGEKGTIHVNDPDLTMVLWNDEGVDAPFRSGWHDIYGKLNGPLFYELQHFFDCVRKNAKSEILIPEDALKAVRVAESIVQSCETGLPVSL